MEEPKKASLVNYYYFVLAPLLFILFLFFLYVIMRMRPMQVTSATILASTLGQIRDSAKNVKA